MPIQYNLPLFRPPSEANSLIFQVTLGCSWNRCSFCEMYTSKRFSIRDEKEIIEEIKIAADTYPNMRKIFLADGDALVVPTDKLLAILKEIEQNFPTLQRVSSYALPSNLLRKSPDELKAIQEAGLKLIYLGIESGDDDILKRIGKGESKASTIDGLLKAKDAGIKSSVMIINGLGGKKFSEQHATQSAEVLNATQPEFASTLVLMHPTGDERFRKQFGPDYEPLSQKGLFEELHTLISHTRLEKTVFRSDHASNYLSLRGILDRDRKSLLNQLDRAIDEPGEAGLREEWQRGL